VRRSDRLLWRSLAAPPRAKAFVPNGLQLEREMSARCSLLNDCLAVYLPVALHELNLSEPIRVLQAKLPVTG
jgi:hypothetical protein